MVQPAFSSERVVAFVAAQYGFQATTIKRLPSERDQNWRLTTEKGDYLLKIANRDEETAVLDLQQQTLDHLATHHPQPHCFPQLLPSKTGEHRLTIEDETGASYSVRLLTYLPGTTWATFNPITPDLLTAYGRFLAHTTTALQTFTHPAAQRDLRWDLRHAPQTIRQHLDQITNPRRRGIVANFLAQFEAEWPRHLPSLRHSIIHGDANDYNVLVKWSECEFGKAEMAGLIDFGDMVASATVFEAAIALAYLLLPRDDAPLTPLDLQQTLYYFMRGYHAIFPLTELELELLPLLITARLCVSVSLSAYQQQLRPDDAYLTISEKPAWRLLETLTAVSPHLLQATLRYACGLSPHPTSDKVVAWLRAQSGQLADILPLDLRGAAQGVDLSVGSLLLGQLQDRRDPHELARLLPATAVSRYNEARLVGEPDARLTAGERHTIHLGMDLFVPAGTAVFTPLPGHIHHLAYETVIVECAADGVPFYIRFNDITPSAELTIGQAIPQGGQVGVVADYTPAHLHLQLITDLLTPPGNGRSPFDPFPGMVPADLREVWLAICPDPNLLVGLDEAQFPPRPRPKAALLADRQRLLGRNLSLAYDEPLHIVRGHRQYLIDETGRPFLDGVNNVAHVGHAHPRVVAAEQRQTAVLNTNTRYLHDNILAYAERLTATLPDPLSVCFFVNSGSEANDLALRLARAYTGEGDILTLDAAYHGNLTSLIAISPYKFDGRGGEGAPLHVHKLLMPDPYRGRYKGYGVATGHAYAQHIQQVLEMMEANGRSPSAFIAESALGCGGQIILPDGYLAKASRLVRDAGGVCIADEVQVGFGRVGRDFWAFATQGVVPDIVTLGKPIGNGHPLAAVVTTPEIAAAFDNGMEYFNTFGGNPVSCAIGLAVLDVITDERLPDNAQKVGDYLLAGLRDLQAKHPLIGDVRGLGLFIGIELVRDRTTLEPAAEEAAYIVNRLKAHGILLSTDGPLHNVLKFKPPLVFSQENADFLLVTLDKILGYWDHGIMGS